MATIQVKWLNDIPVDRTVPAHSVQEIGLHIDVVPIEGTEVEWSDLKDLLKSYFDIEDFEGQKTTIRANDCLSFYSPLNNLKPLASKLTTLLCSDKTCVTELQELEFADSFALTYGKLPENAKAWSDVSDVVLEVYWNDRKSMAQTLGLETSTLYHRSVIAEKVEIGLLSVHPEYTMPGFTWGLTGFSQSLDSDHKEKLLFQYSTKHQPSRGTYRADFERPTGLHPKHVLFLENALSPQAQCSLFAKYTFTKSLFLDKYQLAELNKPTPSRDAVGYLYGIWGEADLEAPIWAVDGYGSEALLQIYTKNRPAGETPGTFQFELPTHSRYEVPQVNSTIVAEIQPWPVVFWACQPTVEEKQNNPSPASVETSNLGYEALFPKNTVFHYLQPSVSAGQRLQSQFDIPVAPFSSYETVQLVTVVAIFGSFFYLIYEIFRSVSQKTKEVGGKKSK